MGREKMIFGNLKEQKTYDFLPEAIQACFKYMQTHDLLTYEKGSHEIDGKNFFVNIEEYGTVKREQRFWEAHKKYIDVHVMLSGKECIDINFIENMKLGEYKEEKDFQALDGEAQASVNLLNAGDFLICYPEDAHRTAIAVDEPSDLKKAIFKVKL